jgi:hypothetical protein
MQLGSKPGIGSEIAPPQREARENKTMFKEFTRGSCQATCRENQDMQLFSITALVVRIK